ncbi:heat shock protein Hsp18 [Clostridium akagii]|uniref:heat shock protein Hsp18 n=1 Tax=Clostridium akagii TaxID=91623 RepID=UPI00047CFB95|nr:heat shock protein Hsp18 [Clostridium akagii]
MFDMVPFRKNNVLAKKGFGLDDLFSDFLRDDFFSPMLTGSGNFSVDLKEDENNYTIEADLPGIKKEDISLEYDNNYLTISAKRDETSENNDNNFVRRERTYGEFKRSFYIDNIDENTVDASFTDGVLKITLPKKEKGIQRKKIDIN